MATVDADQAAIFNGTPCPDCASPMLLVHNRHGVHLFCRKCFRTLLTAHVQR
jgi:ssDNA-binding Zn-finger/Zn-ribbon topoisomerase 1